MFLFLYYPFFYDRTILIVLPFLFLSLYAQFKVQNAFNKYGQIFSRTGYTGKEACRRMLDQKGLYNVKLEAIEGHLNDHYDPRSKVIRLSTSVYNSTSLAAIAVACHEAGHAYQDAEVYAPLKWRNSIIPLTRLGSSLALPLILISLMVNFRFSYELGLLGVLLFSLATIFQLLTLPTEFDASKRALAVMEEQGLLFEDELRGGKKVLSAVALTYVAALAVSLAQLMRILLIVMNNRHRNQ